MKRGDLLKFIEGLEHRFSLDVIKKEERLWAEEEGLGEEFEIRFADFNSGIVIAVLPIVTLLCFVTMFITELFNRFGIYNVGMATLYCYAALFVICTLSYVLIYSVAKKEPFNAKCVNRTIYAVAIAVLIWLFVFVYFSDSIIGSVIVYTATISAVTQTMVLKPLFSGFYIFGSLIVYSAMHIFDGVEKSFETDAIIGMTILSVVWFMVVYMRYYSRCRLVYNERVISAQNDRLDDIVKQLIDERAELSDAKTKLERAYVTDRLTGIYNRWHWDAFVSSIAEDAIENQKDISVIMIDLDNFKSINDTYGHSMGDKCLIAVSNVIKEAINKCEKTEAFRMGGEEFAIVSAVFDKAGILNIANKILKDITNIKIDGFNAMLTASIGVYIGKISSADDVEKHLSKADARMYDAKLGGKNRISFSFGG